MVVFRVSKKNVMVDGQLLMDRGDCWSTIINGNVSQIRLQALYLFLRKESLANFRVWKKYVDRIISELI